MRKKLEHILLIDDSDADNFLNNRVIVKAGAAEKTTIFSEAREALNYLNDKIEGIYLKPAIIFLDINMPGMNGWDFLEEYEKLNKEKQTDIVLCMLTTSTSIYDVEKANEYSILKGFYNKPLTQNILTEIIKKYFPEYLTAVEK